MQGPLDIAAIRRQFPGLGLQVAGSDAVFFDGPAGSQVPTRVADAVHRHLLHCNANHGGAFATSRQNDTVVEGARVALADLFGGNEQEIVFGANMTTLTFHLARVLARTWGADAEIAVSDSDHDANVTPWVEAADDAGCRVVRLPVHADSTLDVDRASALIGPRTRLLALGAASNLSGTIHPVRELCELARAQGALTFVDAVHFAPHHRIDVPQWGCDFAVASAYKFFGPHVGVLWGRAELLARLPAIKVRPAPDVGPERWQTGTANFAGIAGTLAAVDYLAGLAGTGGSNRRRALDAAFAAITAHETALCQRLLAGLATMPVRIVGLTDPARLRERCPTVSFVPPAPHTPQGVAQRLGEAGVFCWAGNSYALPLAQALGLEPHGVVRLGLLHYNTAAEVDRALATLRPMFA
jgi:cysteine desulfurase family protein (TIGR01976 family)